MRGKKNTLIILNKMMSYCDEITQMVDKRHNDRDAFEQDIEFQHASGMCIIQLGELVSRLEDSFMEKYSEIPWKRIKSMRNIYAHDYDIVDNDTVWETITEDIPNLRRSLLHILGELEEKGSNE